MGELLLKKAVACRDRIEKIRRALPAAPEDVLADEKNEAFIAFYLLLLIQDAVDLAMHLIAARGWGVPGSQRESFGVLGNKGVLTPQTVASMSSLAAMRNRIAHAYGELDPVRMVRETPRGLDAVAKYLDELAAELAST